MHKSASKAFTLIELIVVITIMGIVGLVVFENFRSFGQDKDLESAALDIQGQVRTVQTNATTGLKCSGNPATTWKVNFFEDSGQRKVETACQYQGNNNWFDSKIYSFKESINLLKICGDSSCTCQSTLNLYSDERLEVWFSSVLGSMTYNLFDFPCGAFAPGKCLNIHSCFVNVQNIYINLENTKTTSAKQVIIEKGGRVYAQ